MKCTSTIIKMLLLLFITGISPAIMAQRFVHPGIPFTRGDLDQLKANITKEPWAGAYNSFRNNGRSRLSYRMQGPFVEVGRSPDINRTQWQSDMTAILNLSFMWIFTGDTAYARKATDMLDAWAVTNTIWSGGESMLDLGDYARCYVTGADILRGTYPGWTAENTAHVKNYFEKVIWPTSWVPWPLRDHNKGAIQLEIALSVAAFLDDKEKWDQAVEVYRMDAGGGLRNSLPEGEVADAGRDDHWHAQMDALIWDAEVAWKQGVDLFAELDNRLLAIAELYNKYAIDPSGMTYIPFGGYSVYYTNWGIPTGARHQTPYNNIIKAAYSLRKGIATPYTDQMRTLVGEGAGSFLFYKSSDTSTATAPPPIVYPATETVSTLTNIDIGGVTIAGSAVNNNGIWTVKGSGTSLPDVINFSFKQVTGNAAIIVKIESNSVGSANTGLMIRESLNAGANYISAQLGAGGGMNAAGRGHTGRTSGSHWQPKAPWWLKLERVGNRVFTYHSQDGIHWSNNALYIINLPADTYIGFYTLSKNASALNTAVFSNVSITNTTPAGAPVINSPTAVSVKIDTAFRYAITATNTPTSYSATGLPAGLSIDAATGIISGTPTAPGVSRVTLSATNAKGTGTAIIVITITSKTAPNAPPNLRGWALNITYIKLAWGPSTNATSYTVKRALTANGPFLTIQSGMPGRDYVDYNPVPAVTNYYVVTAFAGDLESGQSNVVYATVPPAVPSQPVITNKNAAIDLSWPAVSGAETYIVKRGTTTGGPYTTIDTVATNSYTDAEVTNGIPYHYVVSSVTGSLESGNSPEAYGVPGASAATWSPIPSSNIWNLATDWMEGSVPVSPAILTFSASTDTVITNDISGLEVSRIFFDTNAGVYTISGNSIALKNSLVNNSSGEQTLSMPIVLDKEVNVNTNTQNIVLSGVISGPGTLLRTGGALLFMNAASTYTGNTIINGGSGGWPPRNGIGVAGPGEGVSGAPTSGPLGTGKVIMDGGSLFSTADATLYNDVEITAGKWSFFYQAGGALNLRGKITGSGTILEDCNIYAGLHLFGDNSGFTGEFRTANRSGAHRVFFENAASGSAKAAWILEANNAYGHILNYRTGTLYFGSLSGGGYIRSYGGSPIINIGALNTATTYRGTMRDLIYIEKVGTGTLTFTGNNIYIGTTTILNGTFLLNNNPATGLFYSPVIAQSGAFGGTGKSDTTVTIGTGSGTGATLEPGNLGVGMLTSRSLTMHADATYHVEINTTDATADKMIVNKVTLNNPRLSVTFMNAGSLPVGSAFTIVDNTGNEAVTGTFNGLQEASLLAVNDINFRITYKGGTGNDIVLVVATVTDSTVKELLNQSISFDTIPEMITGAADFKLHAVASSGLPVSFTSSNAAVATIINGYLHMLKAGTTVITASQAGNDTYKPATAQQTVKVKVTGMQEETIIKVDMYPNPATEILIIELSSVDENTLLEVFTNAGALVYRQHLDNLVNTINVQKWVPGLYYIKISNGYSYTNKVLKQ